MYAEKQSDTGFVSCDHWGTNYCFHMHPRLDARNAGAVVIKADNFVGQHGL